MKARVSRRLTKHKSVLQDKMEERELGEQVIGLLEMGEIKQKRKYLEKCSEEMLRIILKKYEEEKALPFAGLATGGLTIGKYEAKSYTEGGEPDTHSPPAQETDPSEL